MRKAVNASALAISLVKEDEVSGEVSFQMTACDKTNVYSNTSVYEYVYFIIIFYIMILLYLLS